ncbi:MAG TPA: hypothetical protein K8U79_13035 [Clostridium perfringens]|nr:hypothetical protein [Clostridium perfringens]
MFKITGKENGVIWDTNKNKPLIKFKKGVAVTKDKEVAEQLKTMGFIVENETEGNQTEDDKNEAQGNQIEDDKNETKDNQIEDEKTEIKDSQTNDKKKRVRKNE